MNSYIFTVIANTPNLFVIVQFCNWLCEMCVMVKLIHC